MTHIQLDYGKTLEFFGEHELEQQKDIVKTLHKTIHEGTGAGCLLYTSPSPRDS